MIIGIPTEIKAQEFRVAMVPAGVAEMLAAGHQVLVQSGAGVGVGFDDDSYLQVGAKIVANAKDVFADAEMIIKVKEPQPQECQMLKRGQTLFTYLHLAPDPVQTRLLKESGCTAIAYETIVDDKGTLPLLTPMSEVAGRLSIQAGARCLEKSMQGMGILLGGVPGVAPANVVIIGGGVAGSEAARMASGMGANVTVFERSLARCRQLDAIFKGAIAVVYSTPASVAEALPYADLVVGAVLVHGARAPKLVSEEQLKQMKSGAVLVDVAIDQGGCFETSKATTHQDPTYIVGGVVHYCVANMPGAVPRTSTLALTNATLPYALTLANKGAQRALLEDQFLLEGLNVHDGKITYAAVARELGYEYVEPREALAN
ncbi:MAG: alanine dehydrogenase [Pseudoalteromonas tetraodonis]|jgi:alanine dehydrogenase